MLLVLAFLMPMQVYLAAVSGQVLDREGKPIAAAVVIYKNIGTLNRNYQSDAGMRSENPTMTEGTGRVYQGKTDKKGAFALNGLEYGVYEITITAPDGSRVYSGRKTIGASNDPSSQNVLNVDLSTLEGTNLRVDPGGGTKMTSGKKTKAQLDLIRQENARGVKINRLVAKYHAEVAVQDWVGGIPLLQQLVALDPNRWEFYQNLGTLQANIFEYQEAAESYAKGVEVAKKVLANASDTDHALAIIGDLLIAEADCYARLQKPEDATALYDKAAAVYPHPYMAHYRACNLLSNQDKPDKAIEKCNQAIADDPTQWGPYQLIGSIYTMTSKPKDALEAYEKGVAIAQKTLEAQPDAAIVKSGLGQMLNAEGN
ncbi:MAG TPA: tetratricopeptide repeat protein, partial [Verrucomicrobiae bacterium]|nr:tetratricopeptide repeat protein [Verrucomicrobiae bacterium]